MDKGLIARGWESFRDKVMPVGASAIQVSETEQAFYAGAGFLMAQMLLSLDPGDDETEKDLAMMDGIHAELVAFARSKQG